MQGRRPGLTATAAISAMTSLVGLRSEVGESESICPVGKTQQIFSQAPRGVRARAIREKRACFANGRGIDIRPHARRLSIGIGVRARGGNEEHPGALARLHLESPPQAPGRVGDGGALQGAVILGTRAINGRLATCTGLRAASSERRMGLPSEPRRGQLGAAADCWPRTRWTSISGSSQKCCGVETGRQLLSRSEQISRERCVRGDRAHDSKISSPRAGSARRRADPATLDPPSRKQGAP